MLTRLKERVQQLMVGEARFAHKIGLTPNQISSLGILAASFSAYLFWISPYLDTALIGAPVMLLISGFFDALDGVLARTCGKITIFGGFLDSLLDRYADSIVLVGVILGWLTIETQWLLVGFTALIGSLLVSYSRARAEAAGIKMETVGVAERAERIMILVAASILTLFWRDALRWGIFLLAVLTNLTVLHRAVYFRRKVREKESSVSSVI